MQSSSLEKSNKEQVILDLALILLAYNYFHLQDSIPENIKFYSNYEEVNEYSLDNKGEG